MPDRQLGTIPYGARRRLVVIDTEISVEIYKEAYTPKGWQRVRDDDGADLLVLDLLNSEAERLRDLLNLVTGVETAT